MYQTTFSLRKWLIGGKEWVFLGVLVALALLFGSQCLAGVPFSDNFDSYEVGLLEGQGTWQHLDSTGDYTVVDSGCHSGKCAYKNGNGRIDKLGTYQTSGSWSFWLNNNSSNTFEILLLGSYEVWDIGCGEIWTNRGGKMSIYDMGGGFPIVDFDDTISNEWFLLTIEFDFGTMKYRAKTNDNEFSSWYNIYSSCDSSGFRGVRFRNGTNAILIDDIGDAGLPPGASVWGDDPASGTEITDLDTTITVGYEGLADYDSVYITFRHPPTGLFTGAKIYEIDVIGDSGDLEINLQDFDIEKNGNWYLHAVAVREGYQIEQGMFLSGYGWIWSEDLTDGDYYLDINIEGFEEIFAMSDFNSWYDENSKFDEPTAMFSAISGFFEPIFSTIGEFGSRIQDYFDTNTAYAKGEGIGRAIPFFAYYVEQVAVFMGGFPLMNWLLVIILLLVGIFIFRIIIKFIPFLGGS